MVDYDLKEQNYLFKRKMMIMSLMNSNSKELIPSSS